MTSEHPKPGSLDRPSYPTAMSLNIDHSTASGAVVDDQLPQGERAEPHPSDKSTLINAPSFSDIPGTSQEIPIGPGTSTVPGVPSATRGTLGGTPSAVNISLGKLIYSDTQLQREKPSSTDKGLGMEKSPGTNKGVPSDRDVLDVDQFQHEKPSDRYKQPGTYYKDVSPDKAVLDVTQLQPEKLPAQDKHLGRVKRPGRNKDFSPEKAVIDLKKHEPEKLSAQDKHLSKNKETEKFSAQDKHLDKDRSPVTNTDLSSGKAVLDVIQALPEKSSTQDKHHVLVESARLLNRLAQSLLSLMLEAPTRSQWNVMFSPMALAVSLAVLAAGSEAETRQELCQLLQMQLPELELLIEKFKAETTEHLLYPAHKVFLEADCPLLETFRRQIEAKYMTTAQNVDFKSPQREFVRVINEWCGIATNGKVSAVVSPTTFPPDTSMVLVSAFFFKGLWRDRFSSKSTQQMQFHVGRGETLNVRMMMRTGKYLYAEVPSLRIRALEVPYRSGNIGLVLILPTEVDGLRITQQDLLQGETLRDVTQLLKPRSNVRLGLPKFVVTVRHKLRTLLEILGAKATFEQDKAHFTAISGYQGLRASELLHVTTLEMSEDGNETPRTVSLVSEVVAKMASATTFLVDRPFLFFVRSTATGAILIMGCVRRPLEWRPESPENTIMAKPLY